MQEVLDMRVILVPVADRPECAVALRAAFDLGRRVDASVSGCHIRPHRYSEVSLSTALADQSWRRKSTKAAPKKAKRLFEEMAERHGFELVRRARSSRGALWAERVGSPGIMLSIVGPVSDLIVVSRPAKSRGVADLFMNSALVEAGCPVLIMPRNGRKTVGRRICIAWNQSSEAAAAVQSALPILRRAENTTIVSCGPEDRVGPKSAQLAAYLTHWGIKTDRVSTRGRDIENELVASYKKMRADLMIAGAYSRKRWREKVFGGTSEYLIRDARMPVLMRHI